MFSQFEEEEVILHELCGATGRFLDLGAYDGVTNSNTRALFLEGWGGTLVEASESNFEALCRVYEGQERVALVRALVTASGRFERVNFYDSGDTRATASERLRDENLVGRSFVTVPTLAVPINHLLWAQPGPYDFVSVDVEGESVETMEALPLWELRTRLVCTEYNEGGGQVDANERLSALDERMAARGFERAHANRFNAIYRFVWGHGSIATCLSKPTFRPKAT